ncbi:hypothetical protein [Streptomyces murinus]|uniref:hypothetical protein n=1 Tax=Streptomyces murinus TaxID=33900 RepID=UPI003F482F7B
MTDIWCATTSCSLPGDAAALLKEGAPGPLLGGEAGLLDEFVACLPAAVQGDAEHRDDRGQDHRGDPGRLIVGPAPAALQGPGQQRGQDQRLDRHPGAHPQREQQQDQQVADDPGGRPGPGEHHPGYLPQMRVHGDGAHRGRRHGQPPGRDGPAQREQDRARRCEADREGGARVQPAVVPQLGHTAEPDPERGQADQSVR